MKRHLFFAVAAATLLSSCTSENILDTDIRKEGNAIAFSTYKTITKGNPVDDNAEFMTNGNQFGVTAFISTNESPYIGTLNSSITIQTDGSKWDYKNQADQAFWPTKTEKLHFYAYAPYSVPENQLSSLTFNKTTGITFKYNVHTDAAKQVDLMFASAKDQTKPSGKNSVNLPFKHALTQLHFGVATKTERLKIDIEANGIKIHNIKNAGTFTLPTDDNNGWSIDGTKTTYTVPSSEITGKYVGTSAAYTKVSKDNNALMLLPQTFAATADNGTDGNAYLTISCKIYQMLADGTTKVYLKGTADQFDEVKVPVSSQKEGAEIWNRGKKVTYNLLIGGGSATGLDPIEFETTVENWIDVDGGVVNHN